MAIVERPNLYSRLRVIVEARRGLLNSKVGRWLNTTAWDGGSRWDVPTMGPLVTLADIDGVTAAELAALAASDLSAQSLSTSRRKDVLTTCAMTARARIGVSAWNALTPQQRVAQTQAEADVWRNIREFLDDK